MADAYESLSQRYTEALERSMRDTLENLTRAVKLGWTDGQFRHWVETGEAPMISPNDSCACGHLRHNHCGQNGECEQNHCGCTRFSGAVSDPFVGWQFRLHRDRGRLRIVGIEFEWGHAPLYGDRYHFAYLELALLGFSVVIEYVWGGQ